MKIVSTWIIVLVVVVLGGWYVLSRGSKQVPPVTQTTQSAATSSSVSGTQHTATPILNVATSTKLGSYLVATNGMTLYTYKKDKPNDSVCTGTCAAIWPPYLVPSATSSLAAAAGVTGEVGIISRAGGGTQVTYKGLPLYFFKFDAKAGETTGQGYKGLWSVARP